MITHWDEVEAQGPLSTQSRRFLAGAHGLQLDDGSGTAISVEAGRWATPLHLEGSEEEISTSSRTRGSPSRSRATTSACSRSGPDDCLVHRALEHAHTIGAGDGELVVLPLASGTTPRTHCSRAPACHGSARPGCCRELRRIIRGRAKPPSELLPGQSSRTVPRASRTSPMCPRSNAAVQPSATSRVISVARSARSGRADALRVPPGMLMDPRT